MGVHISALLRLLELVAPQDYSYHAPLVSVIWVGSIVLFNVKRIRLVAMAVGAAVLACGLGIARADGPEETVEQILDRIESRGDSIEDIRCRVAFSEEDRITEDTTLRTGTIAFKRRKPNPIFLITFDKVVQDGRVSRTRSWYYFDGRYFFEAKERSKSIIKRDLAPPGTELDLFSIDKAPFPIPFGQKKAEILANFDVVLGAPAKDMPTAKHLVCTPKPTSRFVRQYERVEFFVAPGLNLPRRIIITTNAADKVMTADFPDLSTGSINAGLRDKDLHLPRDTSTYTVAEE